VSDPDVTQLLKELGAGDVEAERRLMEVVYDELRALARAARRGPTQAQTLQTTALVHEAYLRLARGQQAHYDSRHHFYAFASRVMHSVTVDYQRKQVAGKRGGGEPLFSLDEALDLVEVGSSVHLLDLQEALEELTRENRRQAELVNLRFFEGLSGEEAADRLGISVPTGTRDWRQAREWLRARLGQEFAEARTLHLKAGSQSRRLDKGEVLVLGRVEPSQLICAASMVSRLHAQVEGREEGFFLKDTSQNGTYVQRQGENKPALVQRGELHLRGRGIIALGGPPEPGGAHCVEYRCE
jgi:RNA polymerase sigma factor (TIGR02999 family)